MIFYLYLDRWASFYCLGLNMSKISTILKSAIDVPLMDVENIAALISEYIEAKIYYLNCELKFPDGEFEYYYIRLSGVFLASTPQEAWELYKSMPIYDIPEDEFFNNIYRQYNDGYEKVYLTTQPKVYHLRMEEDYPRDEFSICEYEYKRPTKNTIRKEFIKQNYIYNHIWCQPMLDIMFEDMVSAYV